MTIHTFQDSLAKSHEQESAPWWREIYETAFPNFASMVSVRQDGWAQRGGIDRVVTLKSGRVVTIDEKVRSESYADILLERWSDNNRKTPGWAQKDLACDYIAYAFIPDRRCYLLPFLSLRAAWLKHGRDWIEAAQDKRDGFSVIYSKNPGYTTENIAVPISILVAALQAAQIVEWRA